MATTNESTAPTSSPAFIPIEPFRSAKGADIILRSSDGVDFHAHRVVLSLVSPVFETMFQLPQSGDAIDEIPVIDMEENSSTLQKALRFFYPGTHPDIQTLADLEELVEVLISKYDMQCLLPTVKQQFEKYYASNYLALYALGVKHSWKDVAVEAAKASLKYRLRSLHTSEAPPQLNGITAVAYHNLQHYHYLCGRAAQATAHNPPWSGNGAPCTHCRCVNICVSDQSWKTMSFWMGDFLDQIGPALAEIPGLNIYEHSAFHQAIQKSLCTATSCSGLNFFRSFAKVLIAQIHTEIDKIELKF
ncbi:hypothetical protein R3P38DRAFT_3347296 [Favolaschia claudopus]|uniref:BTB domain-containing protein n=1 Tax=Favolaschia claudopus TaxID=2862362 RepID=A0AAW0D3B5_9AGAR